MTLLVILALGFVVHLAYNHYEDIVDVVVAWRVSRRPK